MTDSPAFELAPLFQAVLDALRQERSAFNQADSVNHNHGDHMVEIFEIAVSAAREKGGDDLAEAMDYAASLLSQVEGNASAQIYGRGLNSLAGQFRQREVTLDDLVSYVQKALKEGGDQPVQGEVPSAEVLKALVSGLAGWSQPGDQEERPLDMGALFEFGMAYMAAKGRGGSRAEILADAAASVSPLGSTPHRYQSGVLVLSTLLGAIQAQGQAKAET